MSWKIRAMSDLHGWLPEVEPCDILIIAGDVCPLDNHNIDYQTRWLDTEFRAWLESLPADHIIGIAGNHDFVFEHHEHFEQPPRLALPWSYLLDSSVEIHGLKFYGSPWVPNLPNWAFYADDAMLRDKWEAVPDDIDVLITHGPPGGIGDKIEHYGNVGSTSLTSELRRIEPKLHVFGHIHEGRGVYTEAYPEGPFMQLANVAMVDEQYRRVYGPMEFSL